MSKSGKGRRRGFKSWFVEPYKQVRLGLMFLLVNLAFAVMIIGVFGYYVLDIYSAVSTYFKLSGDENLVAMSKFQTPVIIGLALIVLFVLTTILISVRYTHEIYGPLVSIHRYLDDLLGGQRPSPIQLRDSDQLQDLASKLNNLTERLVTDQRAGPLVQIHRYLDELLEGGAPEPIKLRGQDHFTELAGKINQLGGRMKKAE